MDVPLRTRVHRTRHARRRDTLGAGAGRTSRTAGRTTFPPPYLPDVSWMLRRARGLKDRTAAPGQRLILFHHLPAPTRWRYRRDWRQQRNITTCYTPTLYLVPLHAVNVVHTSRYAFTSTCHGFARLLPRHFTATAGNHWSPRALSPLAQTCCAAAHAYHGPNNTVNNTSHSGAFTL